MASYEFRMMGQMFLNDADGAFDKSTQNKDVLHSFHHFNLSILKITCTKVALEDKVTNWKLESSYKATCTPAEIYSSKFRYKSIFASVYKTGSIYA